MASQLHTAGSALLRRHYFLLKINLTILGSIALAWFGSVHGWWPAVAVPGGHIAPTNIYQGIDSKILL
jgi:hypothetical protein